MKTNPHLEESIKHWERLASGNRNKDEQFGSDDCALCKEYYGQPNVEDINTYCDGCPVKLKTGKSHCYGSPFDKIRELDYAYHKESEEYSVEQFMNTQEFKEAAKLELEFLISLRETKE